jgi:uncharacterized OB-fold protein
VTGGSRPEPAPPVRVWECTDCGRTYVAQGETCGLCGVEMKELKGHGRGRLTSWTTVHAGRDGESPYVLGWVDLDGLGLGVLGRFPGDPPALRLDIRVVVRQTIGADGWPRLWLDPDVDG